MAMPTKKTAMRSEEARLLTQRELAKLLRCSVHTVCRKTATGEIPSHRVGRKPLYDWQEVLAATRVQSVDERVEHALRLVHKVKW